MTPKHLIAQATVSDLGPALDWYTALFGRGPDTNRMEGLHEWHLTEAFGVQVFAEPARAGHASIVLAVGDLDAVATPMTEVGIARDGPQPITVGRVLMLTDPDGNRVVLTGPQGQGVQTAPVLMR